jgi:hypothetical protein
MASERYPERQTFLTDPTPPQSPPTSASKINRPFPSYAASKGEVKSYVRALLATYQPNPENQTTGQGQGQGHGNTLKSSTFSLRRPTGGLSTLKSFQSIRSLAMMTPTDAAIYKIWFDGAHLRLLLHIGSLRRELRFLGFEDEVANLLSRELHEKFKELGLKGKVRVSAFGFKGKDEY